jgi:hypothetical protein
MTIPDDIFATAQAIFPLLYEDAPYPAPTQPAERYGAFAEVVGELRALHQAAHNAAEAGEIFDVWTICRDCWEGHRANDDGAKRYGLLDRAIHKIADALDDTQDLARQAEITRELEKPLSKTAVPAKEYISSKIDWRAQGTTLRALQHRQFDPERWIIENILPEGACLLAAKYKSKKSWLSLAFGLAVAMGGRALGRLNVHPGRVLYLDLEGRQQRIQKRTRAILGVQQIDWPENFHVFTQWPQADEGMQELEYWFQSYPDTVLVIIDVLASFRRPMAKHEEIYRYDRDTVDPLNGIGERHHAALVLVHHFNKGKHDDVMDSITGSTGLPSAVNTMWALHRDVNDSEITVLNMRGRDLENDDPLALRWDNYLNQHVIEGPANEVAVSGERKAIMQVLADDHARTPKEIAIELGKSVTAIQQLLRKLLNEGLLDKAGYGKYARVLKRDQTDQTDQSSQTDQSRHSDRRVPTLIGALPTDQSSVGHQNGVNANSDRSDRYIKGAVSERNVKTSNDFSIDCAAIDGRVVWRLWDDITNAVLSEHASEADAQAESKRRGGT